MTSLRFPSSFVLSLIATTAMFWVLGLLIASDPDRYDLIPTVPIEFTTLIPDTPEVTIIRIPPPPIERPTPPPDVPMVTIDPKVTPFDERDPGLKPESGFGDGPSVIPQGDRFALLPKTGTANRAPIPQVRIEPDYPDTARARGIEGKVTFRFTVTAAGTVKDVEILDSDPPRIFDAATIRAVSSWKYQPAVRDGRPVEQRGLVTTYRFELER